MLGFPIHHQLLELAQTHVHQVSDAIQPSHPLLLPSPPFPASGSFPMNQLFKSCGQSIGASASVLPKNIQGWFPLRLTDLISLWSKGLSRVFPSTTVGKQQFFGVTGKTIVDYTDLCQQSDVSAFIVPFPTCSPCVLNNLEAHTPLISVCLIIALPNLLGYLYPS